METQNDQGQAQEIPGSLYQEYREALLRSGIQAAKLLSELMGLGIMPDPRAKDMAEIALEAIRLVNSTTFMSQPTEDSILEDSESSKMESPAPENTLKLEDEPAASKTSSTPDALKLVDEPE